MIKELDVITLTRDIQELGSGKVVPKGSRGAVVHCYRDTQGFEVEFMDDTGENSSVLTVEKSDIQLDRTTIHSQVTELLNYLPEDLLAEVRDFAEYLQHKQSKKVG
ncbi:MAG: DUF4926 domain-containing protein [Cyanobacteria bacterium J06634_5]